MKNLESVLYILEPAEGKKIADLPVAFASNTLYVLERNNAGSRDSYSKLLIPIIKQKAEYLHAEGLAQTIWALAHAGHFDDKALWASLAKAAEGKDFNPLYVQNGRWTTAAFYTHGGAEHFFQSELNEFANQLFFQGMASIIDHTVQTTSTSSRHTTGFRERTPATQSSGWLPPSPASRPNTRKSSAKTTCTCKWRAPSRATSWLDVPLI